ncbi:hypothetical protein [Fulvimarina sp. MAC8]|uniref:hypothetical protein n=1 Tax=Fulvimarina sp. MAC8 TaxID=3162874 RepID=UPI0032EE7587
MTVRLRIPPAFCPVDAATGKYDRVLLDSFEPAARASATLSALEADCTSLKAALTGAAIKPKRFIIVHARTDDAGRMRKTSKRASIFWTRFSTLTPIRMPFPRKT